MDFDPNNKVVKLCLHGMDAEEKGQPEVAGEIFLQAWNEAANDFEKFLAAFYVVRHQKDAHKKLKWLETTVRCALKVNNDTVKAAFPSLYSGIAKCYEELGDPVNAKRNHEMVISSAGKISDEGPFYHGTKAALKVGDMLTAGSISNYKSTLVMNHIYFTALVNGAGLAAALAKGEGDEHVYIVEPTGSFENDPNVTNLKFPGNPTRSYRSTSPLRIVGEVSDWVRQTPEQVQKWREKLANSKGEIIN